MALVRSGSLPSPASLQAVRGGNLRCRLSAARRQAGRGAKSNMHSALASQLGASFGCLARTLSCLLSLRCDKDDAEAELEPQPEPGLFCRP